MRPRTRRSVAGRPRDWKRPPEYGVWAEMRSRCNNPKHPRWKDWGGRGITVCERWASFDNFMADMGQRPPGMTLERIDNERGYGPDNCKWADPFDQAHNKRTTVLNIRKVLWVKELYEAGQNIKTIAATTGIDRHAVGVIVLTIRALADPATADGTPHT